VSATCKASEIWCLTSTLEKKIDAPDNCCLRRILHIHWTDFVSSDVVRSRTGQPLLSDTIRQQRLSFFGHLCCANTGRDHFQALLACIQGPPKDWRWRTGRPRQTWLRTVEDDLHPLNFGLATARRRATDRPAWRLLVDAATSSWHAPERELPPLQQIWQYVPKFAAALRSSSCDSTAFLLICYCFMFVKLNCRHISTALVTYPAIQAHTHTSV